MPLGSPAAKLDRILAGDLAWPPAEHVDPREQIRVPVTAIAGPSTAALLEAGLLSFAIDYVTGYPPILAAPPAMVKKTGRVIVLDPVGLRHVDIPQGVARLASVHLSFAVRWAELSRVTLELINGAHFTQTRMVLVPGDPGAFAAAHPDLAPMHGAAGVGPQAWMLSLGMAPTPDQYVISGMLGGLARYARGLFSGQVDTRQG